MIAGRRIGVRENVEGNRSWLRRFLGDVDGLAGWPLSAAGDRQEQGVGAPRRRLRIFAAVRFRTAALGWLVGHSRWSAIGARPCQNRPRIKGIAPLRVKRACGQPEMIGREGAYETGIVRWHGGGGRLWLA
jgi:hypothetical protein